MENRISITDRILDRARKQFQIGALREAKLSLNQLLSFGEVFSSLRLESHRLLAEIHLAQSEFRQARRHLAAALAIEPNDADLHFQMGRCCESDPACDAIRAVKAYRRAVRANNENVVYWLALGRSAVAAGKWSLANRAAYRAVRLQPETPAAIAELVDLFISMNCLEEAGDFLMAARFRRRFDPVIEKIWRRYQFEAVVQEGFARFHRVESQDESGDILPFPELSEVTDTVERDSDSVPAILKHHRFSRGHSHLPQLKSFRPGPRHVS